MPVYKDETRGTFYVQLSYTDKFGKRKHYKKRGFKRRKEARQHEEDYMQLLDGDSIKDKLPFDALAEEYKAWYKERRKPSSYKTLETHLNTHLAPYFKQMNVHEMTTRDVLDYQRHMLDKDLSASYIKKNIVFLGAIVKHGVKFHELRNNVVSIVGNIEKVDKIVRNYWTMEEFETYYGSLEDVMHKAIFRTLFYSGIRLGELRALTWLDVNFTRNYLNINKTNYKGIVDDPKSTASIRLVFLPDHVMDILKAYQEWYKENLPYKPEYVVFGSFYKSIGETTVGVWHNENLKHVKLHRIKVHEFRHSHASDCINRLNMDQYALMKRLGHSDTNQIQRIYGHLYPSSAQSAIEGL
ncbi:tyrosine-type recombinase/integrase [Salinicoccus sesuvii]|uniref:Tyrosine-type recombinase/integrase n=1 Tax=Salinicoccus sesuvii TaxID=868281 RepID=A0ABV7NA01_9STAP